MGPSDDTKKFSNEMVSLLRGRIPSLGALAAFEAAARLGGFTKAADELNVTQAAISKQIRALEDDLNAPLFVRGHRKVELTAAGRTLADAVSASFGSIAHAIDVIRAGRDLSSLSVSSSLAFSHFWLLPQIASFRAANPELKLRVVSEDAPVDLRDGSVDVAVRYGASPFKDGETVLSVPERAFPVASPELAMRHFPDGFSLPMLANAPLIDIEPRMKAWLDWGSFFALAGMPQPLGRPSLRCSHYSDAVYAAIAGEGVLVGWERLLERPLSDGRLVRLGDVSVSPREGHHVVVSPELRDLPVVKAFCLWLAEAMHLQDALLT